MDSSLALIVAGITAICGALGVWLTQRTIRRKESGDVVATSAEKLWDVIMKDVENLQIQNQNQQTQILQERTERMRLEERVQETSKEVFRCEQREQRLLGILAKAGISVDGA